MPANERLGDAGKVLTRRAGDSVGDTFAEFAVELYAGEGVSSVSAFTCESARARFFFEAVEAAAEFGAVGNAVGNAVDFSSGTDDSFAMSLMQFSIFSKMGCDNC